MTSPGPAHSTKLPSLSFSTQPFTDPHGPNQPEPQPATSLVPVCVRVHTAPLTQCSVDPALGAGWRLCYLKRCPGVAGVGPGGHQGGCWLLSKVLTGIRLRVSLATPSCQGLAHPQELCWAIPATSAST